MGCATRQPSAVDSIQISIQIHKVPEHGDFTARSLVDSPKMPKAVIQTVPAEIRMALLCGPMKHGEALHPVHRMPTFGLKALTERDAQGALECLFLRQL